jgi:hypothetical protein
MEKRLNDKLHCYIVDFKNNIHNKINELKKQNLNLNNCLYNNEIDLLLSYIYDYESFNVDKSDFIKRKRTKNIVPLYDRCIACRSTQEQCSRRKQTDSDYCGTHIKGTPHGVYDYSRPSDTISCSTVSIWAQDINGIIHYIDNDSNVYKPEDVLSNSPNVNIISHYHKTSLGEYIIDK